MLRGTVAPLSQLRTMQATSRSKFAKVVWCLGLAVAATLCWRTSSLAAAGPASSFAPPPPVGHSYCTHETVVDETKVGAWEPLLENQSSYLLLVKVSPVPRGQTLPVSRPIPDISFASRYILQLSIPAGLFAMADVPAGTYRIDASPISKPMNGLAYNSGVVITLGGGYPVDTDCPAVTVGPSSQSQVTLAFIPKANTASTGETAPASRRPAC